MKLFYNKDFDGVWSVPRIAIVAAPSKKIAVKKLKESLEMLGLGNDVTEDQFVEIKLPSRSEVIFLEPGEY